jgi:hypothetical protein
MDLIVTRARIRLLALTLVVSFALTACGGDEETAAAPTITPPPAANSPPPSNPPPAGGANQAPTISGTPAGSTLFGRQYTFTPTAADANGDVLTFSITGRPAWGTFDSATGRLQGTPTQADVGTSANIVISVTDGAASRSLASFNIQVVATATGSATLSWSPPTQNSDGSPLSDLGSYRVSFGTSSGIYPNSVTVNNPGVASFVVDQLTPATWYFVVTAVNASGVESAQSNMATKTVM